MLREVVAICVRDGCGNKSNHEYYRGMCQKHWRAWCKSSEYDGRVAETHKLSEMHWDDRTAICSECGPTKFKGSPGHPQCVTSARVSERKRNLKRLYGITPEHRRQMLSDQGGMCAAGCGDPATHIDHDHSTGIVRGILCHGCNTSLGYAKEDADRLLGLAFYALKHQPSTKEKA